MTDGKERTLNHRASHSNMAPHRHHDEETNQFLGKELKYFSQAGFDLDRIHIKVSSMPQNPISSYPSALSELPRSLIPLPHGDSGGPPG